ncbi:hypothetical protein PMAYCL1PPCAC_19787, partial [Pristionchus mayeri]
LVLGECGGPLSFMSYSYVSVDENDLTTMRLIGIMNEFDKANGMYTVHERPFLILNKLDKHGWKLMSVNPTEGVHPAARQSCFMWTLHKE